MFNSFFAKRKLKQLARDVIGCNNAFSFIDEPIEQQVIPLRTIQQVLEMKEWCLPWYKTDANGQSGYQFDGSANWRIGEYVEKNSWAIHENNDPLEVRYLLESLKQGLAHSAGS